MAREPGGRNVSESIFSTNQPMMGIDQFKKLFLFGVDLRDGDGNELSDETLAMYLAMSISYIEHTLNVPILPKKITQRVDYDHASYRQHMFLQFEVYPIREICSVKLKFTDRVFIDFPDTWWRLYENSGQIQMLPDVSTLSAVLIAQAGQLLPRAISGKFAPQLLEAETIVGLADDNDCVPPLINQAIGLYSAIYLLQMIGDIGPGGGAGLTSQSLSLDGMSQSIATAISATNNLYGATIAAYKQQLDKTVMPLLRKKYKRISLEYI